MIKGQDVVTLLNIFLYGDRSWSIMQLAVDSGISMSEAHASINRLHYSGLINKNLKNVNRRNMLEFIVFGVKYLFPVELGTLERGVETSHSSVPLKSFIRSTEKYVWPSALGKSRGIAIKPLYKTVPQVAVKNSPLHMLLSLIDAIRVGKVRERKLAIEIFHKLLHESMIVSLDKNQILPVKVNKVVSEIERKIGTFEHT